jgi:hypothetical protein
MTVEIPTVNRSLATAWEGRATAPLVPRSPNRVAADLLFLERTR